jgi:hypothetical protein
VAAAGLGSNERTETVSVGVTAIAEGSVRPSTLGANFGAQTANADARQLRKDQSEVFASEGPRGLSSCC